jgi:hypothetical protein
VESLQEVLPVLPEAADRIDLRKENIRNVDGLTSVVAERTATLARAYIATARFGVESRPSLSHAIEMNTFSRSVGMLATSFTDRFS